MRKRAGIRKEGIVVHIEGTIAEICLANGQVRGDDLCMVVFLHYNPLGIIGEISVCRLDDSASLYVNPTNGIGYCSTVLENDGPLAPLQTG